MSLVEQLNIGSRIRSKVAITASVTQSSAALATTQDGLTVDRNQAGLRRYYSCKACVAGTLLYAASSAHTATIPSLNFQHSSDGTSWDNYSTGTVPAAVIWGATSSGYAGVTTAGNEPNTIEQSVNLNGARRYVRIQIGAPTFTDCSSGSVLTVGGVIVFGGADELPAQ
jgi:hypothetical protein